MCVRPYELVHFFGAEKSPAFAFAESLPELVIICKGHEIRCPKKGIRVMRESLCPCPLEPLSISDTRRKANESDLKCPIKQPRICFMRYGKVAGFRDPHLPKINQ